MKRDIDDAPWMSDVTKRAAESKLIMVVDRIGYPDKWRDYETVRVTRADPFGQLSSAPSRPTGFAT